MKQRARPPAVLRETGPQAPEPEVSFVPPQAPAPAERTLARRLRPPWPPAAQAAVGLGSGCALLVALAAGVLLTLLKFDVARSEPPAKISLLVQAPSDGKVGGKISVNLVVRNGRSEAVTVDEVALPRALLAAFDVAALTPSSGQEESMSPTGRVRLYRVGKPVAPGQTLSLRLDLVPRAAGEQAASLTVGVAGQPVTRQVSVRVIPVPAPRPKPGPRQTPAAASPTVVPRPGSGTAAR